MPCFEMAWMHGLGWSELAGWGGALLLLNTVLLVLVWRTRKGERASRHRQKRRLQVGPVHPPAHGGEETQCLAAPPEGEEQPAHPDLLALPGQGHPAHRAGGPLGKGTDAHSHVAAGFNSYPGVAPGDKGPVG